MAKRRTLKFPKEATGTFWYLYWIGNVYYQKRNKLVSLHFVNKEHMNDLNRDFKLDQTFIIKTPISNLIEFTIGSIYSTEEETFIPYFENLKKSRRKKVSSSIRLHAAKKKLDLLNSKYFPNISDYQININTYYKFSYRDYHNQPSSLIISPYIICKYFFFKTDTIINKIINGEILNDIYLNQKKIYTDEETNQKVIQIPFDNSKLKRDDAIMIAPYLLLEDYVGIKLIRNIYSNLINNLTNYDNSSNNGAPFNIDFCFSNYTMNVLGKPFTIKEPGKNDREVFLVYEIESFYFTYDYSYIVDRIELIPINSKTSTKDKDNHKPISVVRPEKLSDDIIYSIDLNTESAQNVNVTEAKVTQNLFNPLDIPVNVLDRNSQKNSYTVINLENNDNLDKLTRELEDLSSSGDAYVQNIKAHIEKINFFEYFENLTIELKKNKNLSILRNPINNSDTRKIHTISTKDGLIFNFDIIEIKYNSEYYYLIEFAQGYMGMFTNYNNNKISNQNLLNILKYLLNSSSAIISHRSLWTKIYSNRSKYIEELNIKIIQGVSHKRKGNTESTENAYKDVAEIIFKYKIKAKNTP